MVCKTRKNISQVHRKLIKPKRSPIPSGGLEIKLNLTFKGRGDLIDKLKLLLRDAYNWDYTGEQTQDEGDGNNEDDNEENDFD